MEKVSAALGAHAAAAVPRRGMHSEAVSDASAGTCPACNAADFESILRTGGIGAPRTLIACSRCSLLRILGSPTCTNALTLADALHFSGPRGTPADRFYRFMLARALRPKLQFLSKALLRKGSSGVVLDCGGGDGTVARALEARDARSLSVVGNLGEAIHAYHRQGVPVVVADPSDPPLRVSMFDAVCRLRGLAHDEDPVSWLQSARRLLKPGGRVVTQTFDSGSWAFLITGSQWAGLEGQCARYAFRAVDLEVLLDFSGFQIARRTHFFPLLNASVWVSSLFPGMDPQARRAPNRERSWRMFPLDLLYAFLVLLALPVGLIESVCHTGSVLMVEAEPK